MLRSISLLILLPMLAGCVPASQPLLPASPPRPTPLAATAMPARPTATATTSGLLLPTVTPEPSPTLEDQNQMTAQLLPAAEAGDTPNVVALLNAGADINGRDALGRTPVMAATHGNHAATVKALIEAGADIDIRDNRQDNPFLYAGAEGLVDILQLTIDAGADATLTNRFDGTALIPAAERGHVEIVDLLLTSTDVEINHVNNLGWTALMEAIVLSDGGETHQQIVQLLVDHGADINIPDNEGVTPLAHAQARGYDKIVAILVAAQARDRQLIAAAAAGDVDTVTQLLAQNASVHAADENGVTALIAAAYPNHVEVARRLIHAGADVNLQDKTLQSAYLISTSDGYLDLLQLTLANGADVHSLDSYNGTGLIRAADRGHVEIIEELLKTDINIDHVNRLDWTALLEAIILGDGGPRHTQVVRLLVEAGANVHLADGNGVTPLEHARQRGYVEMAELLEGAR